MVEHYPGRFLEEVVECPSSEIIPNPTGHGPEQHALVDPALSRGLEWIISTHPFQPRSFCHSVSQNLAWAVLHSSNINEDFVVDVFSC